MTPVEQHALSVSVEERIRDLISYRRWFRDRLPDIAPSLVSSFQALDAEYRAELQSLLALRSAAKRTAKRAAIESWKERHLYGLSASEVQGLGLL